MHPNARLFYSLIHLLSQKARHSPERRLFYSLIHLFIQKARHAPERPPRRGNPRSRDEAEETSQERKEGQKGQEEKGEEIFT